MATRKPFKMRHRRRSTHRRSLLPASPRSPGVLAVTERFPVSRRSFLQTTSGVLAASAVSAQSYARVIGANDRIKVGFVGVGGQGMQHVETIRDLQKSNNVDGIVVADCWKTRADEGAGRFDAAKAVQDYRHVLDNKDVDYVTVAVPEHSHSIVTIAALDAGKAVYCEKPLTHTIHEGLAVAKKQKETKLPLQVGV